MRDRLFRARFSSSLAAALIAWGLAGCDTARKYTVQVDAIAAPARAGQPSGPGVSYHIRHGDPLRDQDSLRYQEVADYVRTALSGRGMYEAPSAEKADVIIEIQYGMEAPRIKYLTLSNPVTIEVDGIVREELEPIRDSFGNLIGYRTITIKEADRREYLGMQETVKPVIIYEKYLKLSARANRAAAEGRAPPEVWSVSAAAEDESQELRRYLPVLASVTADHAGLNTREEKTVRVDERSDGVRFVQQGR
jgi:hypothetical protein